MLNVALEYIVLHRTQLVVFIIIGFLTFGINFGSFHLFFGKFHLDYKLATSFAYVITLVSHFLLHRSFTFKASQQKIKNNIGKYFCMLFVNYMNALVTMWFLINILRESPYLGIVASTGTSAIISFFMMKYFVFGSQKLST